MGPDDPAWPEPGVEHDGAECLALVEVPIAAVSLRHLKKYALSGGSWREGRPWPSSTCAERERSGKPVYPMRADGDLRRTPTAG
jgi:hypothetical protein